VAIGGRKLGDMPTRKIEPEELAQYARTADNHVRSVREASAPDIQVSVEYLEDPPTAVRRSAMRPIARNFDKSCLEAVPVIAVSKDDLAWFELEAEANVLLSLIDGHTSVGDILALVALSPDRAIELLKELEVQRVIAMG
jgi:hypothetical protein